MLKIILETSVLYEDYDLSRASLIELLSIARLISAQVMIPQVVFDEHVQHFYRDRHSLSNQLKKVCRKLSQLPLTEIPDPDIPQIDRPYEDYLAELAESKRILIICYPQISHAETLERCLTKRRPFGEEVDTGYKDTLIWFTVLESLNTPEDVIVFVTSDNDYQGKPRGELHQHLVDDLTQRNCSESNVILKRSLHEASKYLREIRNLASAVLIPVIVDQIQQRVNFDEMLTEHTRDIESCIGSIHSEDILQGEPTTDPTLLWNIESSEIDLESTEEINDEEVVIYANAVFENEVSYWTFFSNFINSEETMNECGISLYESDEEMDSAWVGGSMTLSLSFSFVFNKNNNQVSGFEALEIRRIFNDE